MVHRRCGLALSGDAGAPAGHQARRSTSPHRAVRARRMASLSRDAADERCGVCHRRRNFRDIGFRRRLTHSGRSGCRRSTDFIVPNSGRHVVESSRTVLPPLRADSVLTVRYGPAFADRRRMVNAWGATFRYILPAKTRRRPRARIFAGKASGERLHRKRSRQSFGAIRSEPNERRST